MESVGGQEQVPENSIRKVALASFIGTAIEWYDYFLYGTAAALVFNQLFFPEFSPLAGTLASFATFAVGFFARPVGGVVFGHFGDRIGRKTMLVLTLLIMGVATFLIGLLADLRRPSACWAPILLVVLRIFQGFGVGGEWGGAVLMAVEHCPEGQARFLRELAPDGGPGGAPARRPWPLDLFALLPEEQFLAWGWRIPFLLSIILVGVGLLHPAGHRESRRRSGRCRRATPTAPMPIIDVLRTYPKAVLHSYGGSGSPRTAPSTSSASSCWPT